MYTCRLCGFDVPLDDTLIATARGGCFCLRCYLRLVEDQRPLSADLRRAVAAAAAAA